MKQKLNLSNYFLFFLNGPSNWHSWSVTIMETDKMGSWYQTTTENTCELYKSNL